MGLTEMDLYWMKIALEKAGEAFEAEEVPVGAVLVESSGRFFADRNRTAETGMPTSHVPLSELQSPRPDSQSSGLLKVKLPLRTSTSSMYQPAPLPQPALDTR